MRIRGCGDGEVEEASTFALGALFSYLRRKIAVVKNVHVSGEENFSESLYKGNIHCVNNSAVTLHFNNTRKDSQNWKIAPLNSIAGAGWAETPKAPSALPSFQPSFLPSFLPSVLPSSIYKIVHVVLYGSRCFRNTAKFPARETWNNQGNFAPESTSRLFPWEIIWNCHVLFLQLKIQSSKTLFFDRKNDLKLEFFVPLSIVDIKKLFPAETILNWGVLLFYSLKISFFFRIKFSPLIKTENWHFIFLIINDRHLSNCDFKKEESKHKFHFSSTLIHSLRYDNKLSFILQTPRL